MNRRLTAVLVAALAVVAVSGAVALDGGVGIRQDSESGREVPGESVDGTVIATEGDGLTLNASEGQVVAGRTDLAPGERITVRIVSVPNASTPFVRTTETTVTDNGTFDATVDLSRVGGQPRFEVVVRHDGEAVANAAGRVVGEATQSERDPAESDEWELVTEAGATTAGNASIVVEGDRLSLPATADATVAAETDLDPGTNATVRLRSESGSPFLRSQQVTVGPEGRLSATFNLSTVEPGTTLEASVHTGNATLTTRDGIVVG